MQSSQELARYPVRQRRGALSAAGGSGARRARRGPALPVALAFPLCLALAFALGAPGAALADKVSLIITDSDSYLIHRAIDGVAFNPKAEVRAFCLSELEERPDDAAFAKDSKVIIVDIMEDKLSEWVRQNGLLGDSARPVYGLRGSKDDEKLKQEGFTFDPEISGYYDHLSPENVANMVRRAVSLHIDSAQQYGPVKEIPTLGVYHPGAAGTVADGVFTDADKYVEWYRTTPAYGEGKPWLGLMFFETYLMEGQKKPLDELVSLLEEEGFNVMPAFGSDLPLLEGLLLDSSRKSRVDAVVSFSLKFYISFNEKIRAALTDLDVPIFNAVKLYTQTTGEWRESEQGIAALDVIWNLDNPETSGVIEPNIVMGKVEEILPGGAKAYSYELLPDHARFMARRVMRHIALQRKPAADKRVALIYYNNSRGKQNIGAAYLNVFRSISAIAEKLASEGYQVNTEPPLTEEEIKGLVLRGGRNVGAWAPGELDSLIDEGGAILWPASEYLEYFRKLPQDYQDKVIEQWGDPAKATIMARDGNLVLPIILRGNFAILPQGARGAEDDPMKLYHDPLIYPHHQYLAIYLWLEHVWKADAVIHLGTHGTLEWMPGKQSGLALSDPPEVLMGTLPDVYPYIMDDVGEGIQAKRRGRAVIIDHLVPPLVTAGGYEEYVRLAEIIEAWKAADRNRAPTAEGYLRELVALADELGLKKDLDVESFETPEAVDKLAVYLEYLSKADIPYGLHTFGTSPAPEVAGSLLDVMVRENPGLDRPDSQDKLNASGPNELSSLVRALAGRYIEPGEGNDPARNPLALPTGRNFFGMSPGRLPTPAAWSLGQKAADEIIKNYIDEHGKYPDKVAVILWAVEALRNEGLNESTILALIGVEPTWTPSGVVSGTRPIPGRVLGRPRIDVTIDASGLYRDLFPDKMLFLDKAIRQAAIQDDVENFIAQGDENNRRALLQRGFSEEEAGRFSRARIFSERPGAYGNRVSETVSSSGLWEDPEDVSRVFREHTGYAYGEEMWGAPARDSLELNLQGSKVAWHSVSSHLFGILDNDDVFMFLGGLSMAITSLSGEAPDTFIADQRTNGQVGMADLAGFIGQETRSRYLNPTWLEGMKGEGYAGAQEMSKYVEYLWGWQVTTPQNIDPKLWDQTYEVYVEDKYGQDIPEFMDENNAWAFQSLTGRMLEAVRKNYWAPSEEVQQKLASDYAMSVVTRGIACCDHTCNNPQFNQMVMNIISLPGVMAPELVEQFRVAVENMGKKPLEEQVAEREALLKDLGDKKNSSDSNPLKETGPVDETSEADSVRGLKMEKVDNPAEDTSLSSSGVEWTLSAFVLALLAVFFIGFRRKSKSAKLKSAQAGDAPVREGASRENGEGAGSGEAAAAAAAGEPAPDGTGAGGNGGSPEASRPAVSADGNGGAAGASTSDGNGGNGGTAESGKGAPGGNGEGASGDSAGDPAGVGASPGAAKSGDVPESPAGKEG
ncbi:MAG: cobaltochelatase subunit CobN [Deltaproteobacteria bacterium]|jgi:cobaltochelatase CobN|nr:cobaltochelatase subunit CobN [Deltaproteobacteria bacterium]